MFFQEPKRRVSSRVTAFLYGNCVTDAVKLYKPPWMNVSETNILVVYDVE